MCMDKQQHYAETLRHRDKIRHALYFNTHVVSTLFSVLIQLKTVVSIEVLFVVSGCEEHAWGGRGASIKKAPWREKPVGSVQESILTSLGVSLAGTVRPCSSRITGRNANLSLTRILMVFQTLSLQTKRRHQSQTTKPVFWLVKQAKASLVMHWDAAGCPSSFLQFVSVCFLRCHALWGLLNPFTLSPLLLCVTYSASLRQDSPKTCERLAVVVCLVVLIIAQLHWV